MAELAEQLGEIISVAECVNEKFGSDKQVSDLWALVQSFNSNFKSLFPVEIKKPAPQANQKRKNFPLHVRKILNDWFHTHSAHPFPSHSEKQDLMDKTKLNSTQLNNWLTNARRRRPRIFAANSPTTQEDSLDSDNPADQAREFSGESTTEDNSDYSEGEIECAFTSLSTRKSKNFKAELPASSTTSLFVAGPVPVPAPTFSRDYAPVSPLALSPASQNSSYRSTPSLSDTMPLVAQDPIAFVAQDRAPLIAQDRAPLVSQDRAPLVSQDRVPLVSQDRVPLVSQDRVPLVSQDHFPFAVQGYVPLSVTQDRSANLVVSSAPTSIVKKATRSLKSDIQTSLLNRAPDSGIVPRVLSSSLPSSQLFLSPPSGSSSLLTGANESSVFSEGAIHSRRVPPVGEVARRQAPMISSLPFVSRTPMLTSQSAFVPAFTASRIKNPNNVANDQSQLLLNQRNNHNNNLNNNDNNNTNDKTEHSSDIPKSFNLEDSSYQNRVPSHQEDLL